MKVQINTYDVGNMRYLLKPYNLSDEILSDVSITEVEPESWRGCKLCIRDL